MKIPTNIVKSDLSLVIYHLNLVNDSDFNDFLNKIIDDYKNYYMGQELKGIIYALEWAQKNKGYNFKDLLPDIGFSNIQIITFIEKLHDLMKETFDEATLSAMMVPLDSRTLRILILDDLKYDHTEIKFAHTNYMTYENHNPVDSIRSYLDDDFDLFILSLNQSKNKIWKVLIDLKKAKLQNGKDKTPVLILLENEDNIRVEKLHQLGFRNHLSLPVPTYLLLQTVFRLTAGHS